MDFENYTWSDYKEEAISFIMSDTDKFLCEMNSDIEYNIILGGLQTFIDHDVEQNSYWKGYVDRFFEEYSDDFHEELIKAPAEGKMQEDYDNADAERKDS